MKSFILVTAILTSFLMVLHESSLQAQTVHTVELSGIQFIPAEIEIQVGDTVHWVWVSGFHNVESGTVVAGGGVHDNHFRSGNPTSSAGTIFDWVFDQTFLFAHPISSHTYPYFCVVHAGLNMTGTITVLLIGDIDGDLDIDLTDHNLTATYMIGPDALFLPEASSVEHQDQADIDGDGDVDLKDWAIFTKQYHWLNMSTRISVINRKGQTC